MRLAPHKTAAFTYLFFGFTSASLIAFYRRSDSIIVGVYRLVWGDQNRRLLGPHSETEDGLCGGDQPRESAKMWTSRLVIPSGPRKSTCIRDSVQRNSLAFDVSWTVGHRAAGTKLRWCQPSAATTALL